MDKAHMKGRSAVSLALAMALAACGSQADDTQPQTTATVTPGQDGEAMTAQIRGNNGQTIDITSDPSAPVALPDGFTLYPGARVRSNTSMAMGQGTAAVVSFDSDAAPQEIVDFYRKEAEAAGMPVTAEASANAKMSIAGEAGGGDGFQLSVEPNDTGSTATLMVGRGMDQ